MRKFNKLAISVVLIVSIIAIVTLLSGCTTNTGTGSPTATAAPNATATPVPQTQTLRVGYLSTTTGHALTFVAQQEGYFAKNYLDVQLSPFPNSGDQYTGLLANKLDIVAGGSTAPAVYISQGKNLTIISGVMGEGAAAITLPQNADKYKNITDWKGKNIATVRMSTGDVVYRSALKDAGLNWSTDVNIQELKTPAAVMDAVKSGKADIGILWLPYQQMAELQGFTILSYGDQFYPGHPCCRFALFNTTLAQNRDAYVRFEKSLIEAYHFIKTNPNQTVTDVGKFVDFNQSVIRDSIYSEHFDYSPDPNKKAYEQWWNNMNKIGYINSTVDIDQHIDTSVYKQALDQVIAENPNDAVYQGLLADYQKNDV